MQRFKLEFRRYLVIPVAAAVAIVMGAATSFAGAAYSCKITGYQTSPPIFTSGTGKANAQIKDSQTSLSYKMSYSGLTSDVIQAHIHFGQVGVNGGIIVYLCDNTGTAPSGTPACPNSGDVSGSVTAVDVNPPNNPAPVNDQGISAGDFSALVGALKSGTGYINVHTVDYPNGEIRCQLKPAS